MPEDQSHDILKTERYYLNKRMDAIDETISIGFRALHDAIEASNQQTMNMFRQCQNNCKSEVAAVKVDVKSLNGYKNRAIGAVGVILLILGLYKVG